MSIDCKQLVAAYVDWLKAKITTADINGACEITTPFLDRHNDRLQIYVQERGGRLRLTDDGYIIGDLESSGAQLNTSHRQRMLQTVLNGFGVQQDGGELFVEASLEDFPRKKHALIQAMLTVNDMFMTAKQRVMSLFIEDVRNFLDQHDIRYTPNIEFTGKSGYIHKFDFVIPKSRQRPERLLKAINHPSRDTATSFLFAWTDTKDTRPANSEAYAVLNDSQGSLSPDVSAAFQHYDVQTILWTSRSQFIEQLAA